MIESVMQPARLPGNGQAEATPRRELIARLIERLAAEEITYCHWKSNYLLAQALLGEGDLDLLVARPDIERFESLIARLGFKRAIEPARPHVPSVSHFFALDEPSGDLIHLHVYYRLVTGDSLTKNYCLPLEEMLLRSPRSVAGLKVVSYEAELILFVLRAMLKSGSLRGAWQACGEPEFHAELESLVRHSSVARMESLLSEWLPALDRTLFGRCLDSMRRREGRLRRYWLARKLCRQLAGYRRMSSLVEGWRRCRVVASALMRRLCGRRGAKNLASGGAVVALVGPDACGKSTLVRDTAAWLGKVFDVRTAHLGKPPSTWRTWLPNLLRRMMRFVLGRGAGAESGAVPDTPSLLYKLRAVMLAWDRLNYAASLRRRAANGCLVICDRYPGSIAGAMDGPRLKGEGTLGRLEQSLYARVPPPDVLVRLESPIELALDRNRQRNVSEPETYLIRRHQNGIPPGYPNARTITLSTNQTLDETIRQLREALWENL